METYSINGSYRAGDRLVRFRDSVTIKEGELEGRLGRRKIKGELTTGEGIPRLVLSEGNDVKYSLRQKFWTNESNQIEGFYSGNVSICGIGIGEIVLSLTRK
ncbi:hypothetical protein KY345_07030 [Candidatus Woesearchaeota archaeon]|nr:hypothetical protein [Candidatus Woesearchaeota archaeon]